MPIIFDRGKAIINSFVYDVIGIKPDDRILEIGCGTGSLIKEMAEKLENGCFSNGVSVESRGKGKLIFHCAVATKRNS